MRALVFAAICIVACASIALHIGVGSFSAWGWDVIDFICPLGALETLLAGHEIVPRLLLGVAIALFAIVVFGKAFCSWACPVPRLRQLIASKRQRHAERLACDAAASRAMDRRKNAQPLLTRKKIDSRHIVLGGAIVSSFAFGFPVFCLVCPIGLTFGTVILLWRFVQFNQWTWAIVIFPLIVAVEIVVLRKWCGSVCPVGALLSLLARANRAFVFASDDKACLRKQGHSCNACAKVCPEHIDIVEDLGDKPAFECVKCGRCADACPAHAIEMKLFSKKMTQSLRNEER